MIAPALVVYAPAKLNLTLEVVGKRPDGYHELRSIFVAIDLADRIVVSQASELSLTCTVPHLENPDNLVWRAAQALRQATGTEHGAHILLEKHIPLEAGLGGGSSDAGAVLLALNALWRTGLSRTSLRAIGAMIGSDVPFFLGTSPLARVTGRGEHLEPVAVPPAIPGLAYVLVKPPVGISAGAVYRAFPPERWSVGVDRTAEWYHRATNARTSVDVPPAFNDLEAVARHLVPEADRGRDALVGAGATHVVMAGSGSTFFAVFPSLRDATTIRDRIVAADPGADLVTAVARIGTLADVSVLTS